MKWNIKDAEDAWRAVRRGANGAVDSTMGFSRDAVASTRQFLEDHEAEIDAGVELAKQGLKVVGHGVGAVVNGLAALGEAAGDGGGWSGYTNYDG